MLKIIKDFGYVAALETLVAVAFLITSFLCLYAEAYDGAAAASVVSVIAAALGVWHYRNEKLTGPNLVGFSNEHGPAMTRAEFDALLSPPGAKPRKTKPKAKPAKKKLTKRK